MAPWWVSGSRRGRHRPPFKGVTVSSAGSPPWAEARYNPTNMERTLAIIKPDAVAARLTGRIIQRIEAADFQIRAMRQLQLTTAEAEGFYAVHRERPFFAGLTAFMSSGPVVVLALQGPDAIRRWRELMGATDPGKADPGTLRKEFGTSIERNATHGSDAPETAAFELGYFFAGMDFL
jgi:nucleoside-diphosphate kinase